MQFWLVELAGKLGIPQKSHYWACNHKQSPVNEGNLTSLWGVKAHFLEKGHLRGTFIQPSAWRLAFFWDKFHYHPTSEACLPLSPARVPPRWNCPSFGMTRVYGMRDPMTQSQTAGKAPPRDTGGQWLREFYFFDCILHLTFPTKYVLNSQDVPNTVV